VTDARKQPAGICSLFACQKSFISTASNVNSLLHYSHFVIRLLTVFTSALAWQAMQALV